MEICNW